MNIQVFDVRIYTEIEATWGWAIVLRDAWSRGSIEHLEVHLHGQSSIFDGTIYNKHRPGKEQQPWRNLSVELAGGQVNPFLLFLPNHFIGLKKHKDHILIHPIYGLQEWVKSDPKHGQRTARCCEG